MRRGWMKKGKVLRSTNWALASVSKWLEYWSPTLKDHKFNFLGCRFVLRCLSRGGVCQRQPIAISCQCFFLSPSPTLSKNNGKMSLDEDIGLLASSFFIYILFWWSTSFNSFIRLKRVHWQRAWWGQCQHSCLLCQCSNEDWLPSMLVAQLSFQNLPLSASWRFPSLLFCVRSVFYSHIFCFFDLFLL